ncbi:para-nitrobenzyl esterase [Streptosporangium becharense]|uniref:Carboxylic ester hydrolase n=1 Tax=Streptosporangium becharense TaxID=1816182 RepID=A0A7W9IMY7_9ACTN|nr:carboxylesterase family protein [Streptosporangium becharense]MBB2915400.1 para-nitrobenzyl esterase [Streptosporangium becharense]MBB5823714.1 para-nitrobenzyl esterase [Streptosporangium becharense]
MHDTVKTRHGLVRGRAHDGVVAFKGIPYAAAPHGARRFLPPQPPASWDGVLEADAFGSAPPQRPPAPGVPAVWQPGDGLDCLTVNVWTASPDVDASLPVMVWIYGGHWSHGASSMPHYDGSVLARSGVVVVSFNYRTGFEGFGHLPGTPDNRGLLDQLAALAWTQDNIAAFGGDPGNVTVFGQSAGAASAALLAAAPAATGLFRRCILQSLPAGYLTVPHARQVTERLAAATGAAPTRDGLAALPPQALLEVPDGQLTGGRPGGAFAPVIDGDLVTATPWQALADGRARDLDLLCGFTHEEARGFPLAPPSTRIDLTAVAAGFGLAPDAVLAYRAAAPGVSTAEVFTTLMSDALVRMPTTRTADAHARAGGRTWLYDFAWQGPVGAAHGIDLPFVFGLPDTRYAARFLGSPPPADFATLSGRIRTAWISFAATGDPGWPPYDVETGHTRIWNTHPLDTGYPLPDSRRVWSHGS